MKLKEWLKENSKPLSDFIRNSIYPPKDFYSQNWKYYVNITLQIGLILLLLFIYIDGNFIHHEVHTIEVCFGKPVNVTDEWIIKTYNISTPNLNLTEKYINNKDKSLFG